MGTPLVGSASTIGAGASIDSPGSIYIDLYLFSSLREAEPRSLDASDHPCNINSSYCITPFNAFGLLTLSVLEKIHHTHTNQTSVRKK